MSNFRGIAMISEEPKPDADTDYELPSADYAEPLPEQWISFRVDDDLKTALDEAAKHAGGNRSRMMRHMMRYCLRAAGFDSQEAREREEVA